MNPLDDGMGMNPMDAEFIDFLVSVIGPPPADLLDDADCADCDSRDDCALYKVVKEQGI